MRQLLILTLIVSSALVTCSRLQAASIGMNFTCDGGFCNEPNDVLPGELAGLVPQANWNNANGPYTGDTSIITGPIAGVLVDDSGVDSGATLQWNGGGGDPGSGASTATPNGKLFHGFIQGNALSQIPIEVTVSDVPYSQYDVIVYVSEFFNSVSSATIGSQEFFYDAAPNFDVSGFVQATATNLGDATEASYVLFEGLADDEFTLELVLQSGSRTGITGFQIVNTSVVPEPSTYAMAVLSLLGLGCLTLKRKGSGRRR